MAINFKIFTLFPEMFPGPLRASITGIAAEKKLWSLEAINIRDYAKDKRKTVDDIPYGGGAGMVLKPDVLAAAIEKNPVKKIIYLSARGKKFDQKIANEFAQEKELGIICGRYEGVDQRVIDEFQIEEISIGDYVLSGGEIAAFVFIDAILRKVEGVLGAEESLAEESFSFPENSQYKNLLEYPHYTRPAEWRNHAVPEVLICGNHQKIKDWRLNQALATTKKNRPDLLK